jgi:putative holliday junction resolvase
MRMSMRGERNARRSSTITPHHPSRSTVLAFDFGERRIGVAVGEIGIGIAHPLQVLDARPQEACWDHIGRLVAEWKPAIAIVGLPTHDDDRKHELADAVRLFAQQMTHRYGLPVRLVDERFTSAEAASRLTEAGVRGRAQKPHLDGLAAAAILQGFFDSESTSA